MLKIWEVVFPFLNTLLYSNPGGINNREWRFDITCTVAYQYVRLVQVVYSARGSRLNV